MGNVLSIISKAKAEHWKICIYGLGQIWKNVGQEYLSILKISPDFYCDEKIEAFLENNITYDKRIEKEELKVFSEDILLLLFISPKYYSDLYDSFQNNNKIHIVTFREIIDEDEVIKEILELDYLPPHKTKFKETPLPIIGGNCREKVAVFTCITNQYDDIVWEPQYVEHNCDYYLLTDNVDFFRNVKMFEMLDVKKLVPKHLTNPVDINRYCKMHGYEFFSDYTYSIYIDGNIQIIGPITETTNSLNQYGVGMFTNPFADDPYMEALYLLANNKAEKKPLIGWIKELVERGVKRHCGCLEGSVIVCNNQNTNSIKILDKWYTNYIKGKVKRDQLYLQLSLDELGIGVEEIDIFKKNWRTNGITRITKQHTAG